MKFSYMQEYTIDSDWRFRSTVLTPMFVETQASQGALQTWTQEGSPSAQGAMTRHIRATQQQYDFTPTQNTGKHTLNADLLCARLITCRGNLCFKNLITFKIRETIIGKKDKNHKKRLCQSRRKGLKPLE